MPGFLHWWWVPQSHTLQIEPCPQVVVYFFVCLFVCLFVLTEFAIVVSFRYLKIPLGSDSDNIPL